MTAPAGRLAVITNDYPPRPGGIQQYLGNLVDAYPGVVRVLAPRDAPADATAKGEPIVRRSRRRFMWPTPAVASWVQGELADFGPDLVLFGAPHPLTALIPRLRRVVAAPMGVLCHGAEVTIPAALPGSRQVLRRWLRAADHLFAVSRFTAGNVERLTGRPVVYVGGGVDVERFAPRAARGDGVPIVGCVSRFVPRKGQHRLIDAAAALQEKGVDCEVLLVGRGRSERALRRRAARRRASVRFAVDVRWDELPGLYAGMDVFCMPCRSRWGGLEAEGLGLVFLEAAAAGLPVLAGDSGGAPETVVPGVTGFVVHDVDGIVEGLEFLLENRTAAAEMARRGRRRVEEEYTWPLVVRRLLEGFAGGGAIDFPS